MMRSGLLSMCLALGLGWFAGSTRRLEAAAVSPMRLSLMRGWKIRPVEKLGVLGDRFYRPDFDDSAWDQSDIRPVENPFHARYVLYRLRVRVPAAWKGRKIAVGFQGVDDDAVVYFNGTKLGEHQGWDEFFSFDVTKLVAWDKPNLLAVLADNSGGGGSGIWRPVTLYLPEEEKKKESADRGRYLRTLAAVPYDLVYESYRDNNWEICRIRADGSAPVNLTRTPDVNELYPHVSPDGKRICFSADEGQGKAKVRSVYIMNMDGSGRLLVARHARQACWSPDGKQLAYLRGEEKRFVYTDYATKGIVLYDLATKTHRPHPNADIRHLYNLCWSPDGRWFVATVHAGMGFKHAILAIEAHGKGVYNLDISGCRPDISPDGKHIAWGASDWILRRGELDFSGARPRVLHQRNVVTSSRPMKIYHVDWSPDGKLIAFSRGPSKKRLGHAPEIVGIRARGWEICVADATALNRWVAITSDGRCNKEPDWIPTPRSKP